MAATLVDPFADFGRSDGVAPSRYQAGVVIGDRYELIAIVGRGGLGEVWLAHNRLLDNDVALKVYAQSDPIAVERLRLEARTAAALQHPAIVRVFDFGTTHLGDPYLVMELLCGENLEELLQQVGKLGPRRSLRILLPIVEGIACAHEKGMIHRDIKLSNIVLTREGACLRPKLVDFGLAKSGRTGKRITMRGELVGTPAYMSPEQASGAHVDARSDVWSMSIALYELLTGTVPFEGHSVFEGLRAVREDTPERIVPSGAIDEALVTLVMKGLAKSPDARWPSMRALGIAMATWLLANGETEDICGSSLRSTWLRRQRPILAPTPPPFRAPLARPSRRSIAIAASAFATGIAVIVACLIFSQKELASPPPAEAEREMPMVVVRPSITTPAPRAAVVPPTQLPLVPPPAPPPVVRDPSDVF